MKQLLFFILLFSQVAFGQAPCNCTGNLNHAIEQVSANYSGFKDKVTTKTQAGYTALVDSLKKSAAGVTDLKQCYDILERYRSFFKDGHLQLYANLPSENTGENSGQPNVIQSNWTAETIKAYLEKHKRELKPLEGLWTTNDYKIGIVFNKKKVYEAVVLSARNERWKEGMVKFTSKPSTKNTYKTEYVKGDFQKSSIQLTLDKNYFYFEEFGYWRKEFPLSNDTISEWDFMTKRGGQVLWYMIDPGTLYIGLKSCDLSNKPILDSLIKLHTEELKTIPNWIFDVRNNGGGATDVYKNLLPYMYTNPCINTGTSHWMSPDNTTVLSEWFEENKASIDPATYNELKELIQFGKEHPNTWHNSKKDTTVYDNVYKFPKRIAILSNRGTASSGESLLLDAHCMSKKSVIFGQNSGGYLDYGDVMPRKFPCENIMMFIPTSRHNRLDAGEVYDLVGYPPDIRIPNSTKDWIQFVRDYWKKN